MTPKNLKIRVTGPPNSFKSTVGFLISRTLREAGIAHTLEVESLPEVVRMELNLDEKVKALKRKKPLISIQVRQQHRFDPEKSAPHPGGTTISFE